MVLHIISQVMCVSWNYYYNWRLNLTLYSPISPMVKLTGLFLEIVKIANIRGKCLRLISLHYKHDMRRFGCSFLVCYDSYLDDVVYEGFVSFIFYIEFCIWHIEKYFCG